METKRLTRKELYDLIWCEPMTILAHKFGFSDVWLAKICRRNKIPRPPRGYWAIIQAGRIFPKTPLPKGDTNKLIEIVVHEPKNKNEKASPRERISKKITNKIVFPDQTSPHKYIMATREILSSVKPNETGLIPPRKDSLNIHVSEEALSRALCIMDNLIKIISNIGYDVSISGEFTEITVDGVRFGIAMSEELNTRRRVKAVDHKLEGYYQFGYDLYEKVIFPSGRLCISINNLDDPPKTKSWRDSNCKKLEDYHREIIFALIRMAMRKNVNIQDREISELPTPNNI